MDHRLETYLSRCTTPERMVIYKDAVNLLLDIDREMYDILFDGYLDDLENYTTEDNLLIFDSMLVRNLTAKIEEFCCYLNDRFEGRSSIHVLTALLGTLYSLENYPDPMELQVLIDGSTSDEELLGECTAMMSGQVSVESVMSIISDISPSLIAQMRTVNEERVTMMSSDNEVVTQNPELAKRVNYVAQKLNDARPIDFVREGGVLGNDIDTYINIYYQELKAPTDRTAALLVLCGVMAGLPAESIAGALSERLSALYPDAQEQISVGRMIQQIDIVGIDNGSY